MAWVGELSGPAAMAGLRVQMVINYYDDVTPANVLHTRTFSFDPASTIPDVTAAIVAEGQKARTAVAVAAAFNASVPVGTKVGIT